jgi:hypothetical protein
MSDNTLDRLGGGILATGAVMTIAGSVLAAIDQPGGSITPAYVDAPIYTVFTLLLFLGSALLIVGLAAVVARQFRRSPVLTLTGAVGLGLVLLIQGVGNGFVDATVFPPLIDDPATRAFANAPAPGLMGVLFLVGMAGALIGGVLLGISVLRAKEFRAWTGVALLVAVAAGLVSMVLPAQFESLQGIIASIALLGMGLELTAPARQVAERRFTQASVA